MVETWTARVHWTRVDRNAQTTTLNVEGSTLRQATWDALKKVEDCTGGRVIGIEILAANEYRRRSGSSPPTHSP